MWVFSSIYSQVMCAKKKSRLVASWSEITMLVYLEDFAESAYVDIEGG
jgi:hypothetical protein